MTKTPLPPLMTSMNQSAVRTKRSRDGKDVQLIIRICKKGMYLLFLLLQFKDNFYNSSIFMKWLVKLQ